ncbi:unnamed protein product [Albugo candida]|uniref:Nbr1 FW domain-containing protein n=1 Tax=Albugo candida TaxID=65357 RepID=A0A024GJG9_9STRA|nr:unnamed protein product [Albugo candida]|eukprot:CCI46891.1 unnamed protein product [Albugo candida]
MAPDQAGRCTGYWRLSTQDNVRFRQRIWVDINVINSNVSALNVMALYRSYSTLASHRSSLMMRQ